MSSSISKFLNQLYVEGVYYTHVSMITPRGKYQLNRDLFEEFWEIYNENLITKEDNFIIGLAEKPQNYMPVLCDIDIKKTEEEMEYIEIIDNHIYTEKNLKDIVEIYQSVLRNVIDDCTDDHLLCVILEKDMYTMVKNGLKIYKSGFHLHFPNCFLSKCEQENHVIPRIQNSLKELNVFSNLNYEDSSVVLDAGYLKAPWLLYGSRKEGDNMRPYKVTKIINSAGENISIEEAFKYYNVYNVSDQLLDIKNNIVKNLPRILSILPSGRSCSEIKYGLPSPIKEKYVKKHKIVVDEEGNINDNSLVENLNISKKLLTMISDHRADDRNEWISIGWALYNIGDGCSEALQQWIDFSTRCEDKFDENICINEWKNMVKKDITLGTLHYLASIDNEELYKEFQIEKAKKHIEEGIEGSHNDIAKLMHVLYGTQYVCSSIINKTWYQFKNHHWEEIEGGIFLREKISSEIVKTFGKHGGEVFYGSAIADKSEDKVYHMKIKQLTKLISNLKNSPYKSNIMNEACEVFFNKNFKDKLDINPYLIGFKNGVYDLKLNIFRAGRPEDYISKCMPINYINFNKTDKRVLDVYDYLEKVFPDTSVRNYFLDNTSDIFEGGNKQKTIIFWTGEGDNAKSVTQTILERMLGPYAIKFNTTLVTGKKTQAGSTAPELARAGGGVRWAVLEEPDGDEELNVGMLKSLSGNDSYWARDLFEKGKSTREIVPLFKLIFICLAGNTAISLANGISVSLEKLIHNKNQKLLSWDSEKDGLIKINQNAFIKKGLQNCITLTLQDGRKITCTPNHKFLTNDNEWIEAQNIKIKDTFLKMGIDNPKCDDIFNNYDYTLECGEYNFNCNNYNDRLQAMSYVRLLGYILSDGSCNKLLYPGHQIDGQSILDDIQFLTNKIPKLFKNKKVFQTSLPNELVRSISTIIKYQKGGRINNDMILPDFIFDKNCPTFIIREFVAALFGGDGILPCLTKNCFTNIQLVASKINEKINSLIDAFNKLSILLKDKFNIDSNITTIPYNDEPKTYVFLNINKNESKIKFCENIGIRYCCHKLYRLMSVTSYYRYKNFIIEQNQMIIKRTKELKDKYDLQNPKPIIIQKDKYTFNILNTFKSTQEVENTLGIYHSNIRDACLRNGSSGGFLWEYKNVKGIIQDEPGCETIKNSYLQAVNEIISKKGIINKKYIINYTQVCYYLNNNMQYEMPSFIDIKEFLEENNLFQFMNQGLGKTIKHYSVDKDMDSLPCYKMQIINIENSGMKEVFDINVDEPYSNFLAEGISTHNCNKLIKIKHADKAFWNRVKVLPFETTFVRPGEPCPEKYEEQLEQKRFPMDPEFNKKIPSLLEPMAWLLLEHRKSIQGKGRIEPEKVKMATNMYRKQNDIYRQFIDECVVEAEKYITLTELYEGFSNWYRTGYPKHTMPIRNEVQEYFTKLWDEPQKGMKWYGYRIKTIDEEIENGDIIVLGENDIIEYDKKANKCEAPV